MDTGLLTIPNVAEITGLPVATIRHWVATQTQCGPLFARVGRRRLARRSEIEAWLKASFPSFGG